MVRCFLPCDLGRPWSHAADDFAMQAAAGPRLLGAPLCADQAFEFFLLGCGLADHDDAPSTSHEMQSSRKLFFE